MCRSIFSVFIFILLLVPYSVNSQKRELDEKAYMTWRRVDSYRMSEDGKWVIYKYMFYDNNMANEENRDHYFLYEVNTGKATALKNIDMPEFFAGGTWLSYSKTDTLSGEPVTFRVAHCLANNRLVRLEEEFERNADYPLVAYQIADQLIVKNLDTKDSTITKQVATYRFYDRDWKVIYIKQEADGNSLCYGATRQKGIHHVLYSDKTKTLKNFYFNEIGKEGHFLIARDSATPDAEDYYTFSLADGKASKFLGHEQIAEIQMDLHTINEIGKKYLLYERLRPARKMAPKGTRNEEFKLELWSWNDLMIPSQQAKSGFRNPESHVARYVYDLQTGKSVQVCGENHAQLYTVDAGTSVFAYEKDEKPYMYQKDWLHDDRYDLYLVNLSNGEHRLVAEALTQSVQWSPDGRHLLFFDNKNLSWVLLEAATFTRRDLADEIPHVLYNELHDRPNPPSPYGAPGWSNDGSRLIVYDRFDIWIVPLSPDSKAYCWTKGSGREQRKIFRLVNPGYNSLRVDLGVDNLVTSFDWESKDGGMYRLASNGKLFTLLEGAFDLSIIQETKDGKRKLCMKQSYQDDRDLWVCDGAFKKMKRVTTVNPQQSEYKWGTIQQVEWTNDDGAKNKGLLYFPDDYVKGKRYPAIVSFYETHTPEMHIHPVPGLSQAMIDIPTYVSKGYIVFQPDVYIQIGKPGKSAYNSVVSGTKALIERGIIDPRRVGLQGHSWSGFLVSYLVTQTDMFTCVNIGAATVNLTSIYTGLREGSGMPNMFMFEDWQCRMGAMLWENMKGYIENSPYLFANRIRTPALIFHCDQDEAVSYCDGRSLFLALRRLQRPAWLLNYMGEGHFLTSRAAEVDWTLRMEQFFNHYLKETPMPRWMKEGININERGYDQKYDCD